MLLDKLSLEKEKSSLLAENAELRSMLKDYLDGVSVNEEVMRRVNPLMIVNAAPRVAERTAPR